MIKQCFVCNLLFEESDLKDIRGNTEFNRFIITQNEGAIQINEKDPIEICYNCENILRDQRNNSRVLAPSNSRESEDIPIVSQSLESHIEPSLNSSIENPTAPPSFDLEKLMKPGEVEKLTNDPRTKRKLREGISQPMPATAKRRKINEILGKTQTDKELGAIILENFLNQPDGLIRTYKESQEVSPSVSFDSSNHDLPQHPQRRKSPPLAVLYEHYSSSDRESDTGSGRRSLKKVGVRNQNDLSSSEDKQAAERRRRYAERQARSESDERRAAQANAERQRQKNDGNDHSNFAAPRRLNLDQPIVTRREIDIKITNGG